MNFRHMFEFLHRHPISVDIISKRAGREEVMKDKARFCKSKTGAAYLWLVKSKDRAPPQAFDNIWKYTNDKKRKLYLAKYGKGLYDPLDLELSKGEKFAGKLRSIGDEIGYSQKMVLDEARKSAQVFNEPSFFERYGAFITAILVLVLGIIFMWVTVKNLGSIAKALGSVADKLQFIPLAWYTCKTATSTKKTKKM